MESYKSAYLTFSWDTQYIYQFITNLNVIMRIPVHVVDDDGVSWRQIDTETTGACWQQKHKLLRLSAWTLIQTSLLRTTQLQPSLQQQARN